MVQNSLQQLLNNLSIILSKYFQAYQKITSKKFEEKYLPKDPFQLNKLFLKFFTKIFSDPDLLLKYQISFFQRQFGVIDAIYNKYYSSDNVNAGLFSNFDKRFKDSFWQEHSIFAWVKEAYYSYTKWFADLVEELPKDDFSAIEIKRLNFIIKQFFEAISPSNFPSTNPEVLRAFFDTCGENFIKGLDNLLNDIESSSQALLIKTSNSEKFHLGKNIATTKGKVIYQNHVMQLIHYKPLKQEIYSVPMLIVSPFINKYYILDLEPETSFVRWLLECNHDVFVISWVNPDEKLSHLNFEDYMENGPLAAIDYITKHLQISEINTLGYCIGGTLLSATLAYMRSINDYRVKTASFMTSLIDFADAGDISIFIDDHFLKEVDTYMEMSGGVLDGKDMSFAFNLLRSNDMIWPFYVNNYLLGKDAFPFDLLHWNSDSVRMPKELNLFCLKNMYKDNLLKTPGGIRLKGENIEINKIDIPCFAIAAKADHIVPWQCAFNSAKLFSGPVTFALTDSGHVAGMINHPNKNKYCFWSNNNLIDKYHDSESWYKESEEHKGSWWNYWNEWLESYSGELKKAKHLEDIHPTIIENAPGSYVMVKC